MFSTELQRKARTKRERLSPGITVENPNVIFPASALHDHPHTVYAAVNKDAVFARPDIEHQLNAVTRGESLPLRSTWDREG
jgi:hypothetical protein